MLRYTSTINNLYRRNLLVNIGKLSSKLNTYLFIKVNQMMASTNCQSQCSFKSFETDRYNGVRIDSKLEPEYSDDEFSNLLSESLGSWKQNGVRGVWFKVYLDHSKWIPILAKNGFLYHHARNDYVTMIKWLPDSSCLIPNYPHTFVGVGAIVINENNEILTVKEKRHLVRKIWKFPGGYAEKGEDFGVAACREVKEETGIDCSFVSMVALRHQLEHQFDCADIHVICHVKPHSKEIKICEDEIEKCQWMDIDEYLKHKEVTEFCKFVLKSHLENQKEGLSIKDGIVDSIIKGKVNKIFHIDREKS